MPDMRPVRSSSMIEAIGYDHQSRTLRVKFTKNNQTWDYFGVPPEQFHSLKDAESIGQYFARNIRDSFSGRKV